MKFDLQRLMKAGSTWALADQMVASAGNFATALILARALPPSEFGTFALINSVCLIAFGLHANLIISPLVVMGASASAAEARIYPTVALGFTLALLPISALAVFIASVSLHREVTGLLAIFYILALQLQETTRRALLSRLRYRDALWGDAISYPGQALLVVLLFMRPGSTLNQAFALMAATSLAAAALQFWQSKAAPATWKEYRANGIAFWSVGKWLVVASITTIVAGPLVPWLLNWFHGREASAAFQAVMNVLGLANPLIVSIPTIVMPAAANFLSAHGQYTKKSLFDLAMKYVVQMELILAPWFAVLMLWPHSALMLFYGKASEYGSQTLALRIGISVYLLTVPMTVFGAVLTGSGKTKSNAAMQVSGSVASLVCAPPLIFAGGVPGAMIAETLSRGVRTFLGIKAISASEVISRAEAK
jgi:O-antigen/teichoic acid export membrane protein